LAYPTACRPQAWAAAAAVAVVGYLEHLEDDSTAPNSADVPINTQHTA
jgi:hypothetical protein